MRATCGCVKPERTVRWLAFCMECYRHTQWWGWLVMWDLVHGPVTLKEGA